MSLGLVTLAALLAAPPGRPELVVQAGHRESLTALAFSADGRLLVTGSKDTTVIVWEPDTGRLVRSLGGHDAAINSVAISPDGTRVLSAEDAVLFQHDAAQEWRSTRLAGHTERVTAVSFTPDGSPVSAAADGTVILWDGTKPSRKFTSPDENALSSVAVSPDGRSIAAGCHDGNVFLWAITGGPMRSLVGHTGPVESVAFSGDGHHLISGGFDKTAVIWDLATGKAAARLPGHERRVTGVALSDDGKLAVTAAGQTARLWNVATATAKPLTANAPAVAVGFRPGFSQAAIVHADGTATLWDTGSAELVRELPARDSGVTSVAVRSDGKQALIGSRDAVALIWDLTTGRPVKVLRGHKYSVSAVAWHPDGSRAATAANDRAAIVWDMATGEKQNQLTGHTARLTGIAFAADDVFTAAYDGTAIRWNAAKPTTVFRGGHDGGLTGLAVSASEPWLLTAGLDGQAILRHAGTAKVLHRIPGPDIDRAVTAVAVSADGRTALLGGEAGSVAMIDLTTGKADRSVHVHAGPVRAVALDGQRFATAGDDRLAAVWDATSRKQLVRRMRLTGHAQPVTSVAFLPDGKRLLTGSLDGTARLWDIATGRELVRLIALDAGREWLAVTPDGYFTGSDGGKQRVGWRVGGVTFPVGQFAARFDRPDLVAQAIQGEPLPTEAVATDRTPPRVALDVRKLADGRFDVRATASPTSGTRIVGVRLTVDGRELPIEKARKVPVESEEPTDAGTGVFTATLEFPAGRNRATIAAVATDDAGLVSEPAVRIVTRAPVAPTAAGLVVLTVGVSRYRDAKFDLEFARADATSLAAALNAQKGRAFAVVRSRVVADADATAAGVQAGLAWLAATCDETDVAVVLFSGHGVRDKAGKLYYFTHDGRPDDLPGTSVPWSEVAAGLRKVKARQVLFLADCCHAGAFADRSATQDELIAGLSTGGGGVMVFASCLGTEQALERADWGHGAFTKAILEGLAGAADLFKDGKVTVSELQAFVANRVVKLTNGRQNPHIPRLENFDPNLVLAQVAD